LGIWKPENDAEICVIEKN